MTVSIVDPQRDRQLRGLLLRLLYLNHSRQDKRANSTLLAAVLQREGYDFSDDQVLTMLQDLRDRDYLRFQHIKKASGRVYLFNIELTSKGRDLMDGISADPAVQND